MKKTFPYIIIIVILAALAALMMGKAYSKKKRFDERLTLRKNDQIPYGTYAAWRNLKFIFPHASISTSRTEPGYWDSLSEFESKQALLIIVPRFTANESEMEKLIDLAKNGNDVFISAREFSIPAQDMMKLRTSFSFGFFEESDSLLIKLKQPPFGDKPAYNYPGKKFDNYLVKHDSDIATVLGTSFDDEPDFIRLQADSGNIYMHLAPLAFSNYFLLHKNNMEYYNNVLSVIPAGIKRVVWDEYFLSKMFRSPSRRKGSWLGVMMRYPPLKWGLLIALFTLILFVLLEMRRKQRSIPVLAKPQNDWLDFVKTIGRLYYDKKDHRNLCKKMTSYFLEHVRNRYKLPTAKLDDGFVRSLHYKSGYQEKEIKGIVSFINFIDTAPAVSDGQLEIFYKQLETFYKNT